MSSNSKASPPPGADRPCCKATTLLTVAATSFVSCFLVVVVFLFLRFLQHRRRWRRSARLPEQQQQQYQPKLGLDTAAIALIPSFPYRGAGADGDAAVCSTSGPAECAVCLSILDEGQMARELPSCKHVFHQGCIDVWLASRASCPVCRGNAEPVLRGEGRAAAPASSSARVVAVEMFDDGALTTSSSTTGEAEAAAWTRLEAGSAST